MTIGLALAGLTAIAVAAHPRGVKRLMGFAGTQQEHIDRAHKLMKIYKEKHDRKINPGGVSFNDDSWYRGMISEELQWIPEDQADAIWETMQKMKKNIR